MDILELVRDGFVEATQVDRNLVTADAGVDDIAGWDSTAHTYIVSYLEEKLGFQFEIDEIIEMESVAAILNIIQKRLDGS